MPMPLMSDLRQATMPSVSSSLRRRRDPSSRKSVSQGVPRHSYQWSPPPTVQFRG